MTKTSVAVLMSVCLAIGYFVEAGSQQTVRVYRIAFLATSSAASPTSREYFGAFKKMLQDVGYVEGRNLVIDARWSEGSAERVSSLAAELVAMKPDVIVANTTPAAAAIKRATSTIPIVLMIVSDPVGSGLVASLAHPGGNITGVTDFGVDIAAKTLEIVHGVVPKTSRIAVLMSDNPVHPFQLKAIQDAAAGLSLTILPALVRSNDDLENAFVQIRKENAKAVIVLGGPPQSAMRERIAELAVSAKVATISPVRPYVEAGGLLSYGPSIRAQFKLAVAYIDQILKGAKPGDLPVQQPTDLELVVNLKTAKAIGVTIPQSILLRASELIE